MRACDFLVHPSLNESFGCVIVEAMACGKPVLATRCGGPEEIIVSRTGILVNPANVDQLTSGLEYMLDHLHQYDPETIAGYTRRRFSCKTVGQALDKIFYETTLAYVRNCRVS
jgi:glycosyltransferase involved in cell wall biosynthesis